MERSTDRRPAPGSLGPLGNPRNDTALEDTEERLRNLEWALRRRDGILAAVGFAAERFLGPSDWEASVREVLDRLGRAAEVSRVDLFELCRDQKGKLKAVPRYEWVSADRGPPSADATARATAIPRSGMTRWYRLLSKGETIHGPVRSFPARERTSLAAEGIRSLAVVPVREGADCWGALRFVDSVAERDWSAIERQTADASDPIEAVSRALFDQLGGEDFRQTVRALNVSSPQASTCRSSSGSRRSSRSLDITRRSSRSLRATFSAWLVPYGRHVCNPPHWRTRVFR